MKMTAFYKSLYNKNRYIALYEKNVKIDIFDMFLHEIPIGGISDWPRVVMTERMSNMKMKLVTGKLDERQEAEKLLRARKAKASNTWSGL